MKKFRLLAVLTALVLAVGMLSGCGANKGADGEYKAVLKYEGKEFSSKYYSLIADVIKSSYLQSKGYADGDVDKSQYMTLKHILVNLQLEDGTTRTEEEALAKANEIKAQITDDNFDTLMAEFSEDPGSKSQPQGYTFAHGDGTMMQEFDDGGWALEIGQVSEPVKTSYGYHIIKRVELNEEGLPKSSNEINWNEEMDGENKVIDIIRENAYTWLEETAILSTAAKNKGLELTEDGYEEALKNTYQMFGGEEAAKKFFEKRSMSEEEIEELVTMINLSDRFYSEFTAEVDCAALFDEFIASEFYTKMKAYYSQYGQEMNYTEYSADDEELNQFIKGYAFDKFTGAEKEKVEKVDDVYNSYI